jgi:hypothetical protein
MKSLLKFITTEDRAMALMAICNKKGFVLQHKTHHEPLTEAIIAEGGFTVNFGGYGSYSRLGLGANFNSKWIVSGLDSQSSKTFSDVMVGLDAGIDNAKLMAIDDFVAKHGGTVSIGNPSNCDLYIMPLPGKGENDLIQLYDSKGKGKSNVIVVSVDEFLEVIPVIKKPRPKTAKISQLSVELKSIFKLLQERSYESIDKALLKLNGNNSDIDILLMGVGVDKMTGELERGPKFKGSGPAMEYLDIALFGLLSIASDGSEAGKIRSSVRKIKTAVKKLPSLIGFNALEELEIIINRTSNNEKCITNCDLTSFGPMPSLKKLVISNEPGYDEVGLHVGSLKGLSAEGINELIASDIGLVDVTALDLCKDLEVIDLSQNACLDSIESLSAASAIKKLFLNDTCIKSLLPLSECSELEELCLDNCSKLKSLEGLNSKKVTNLELNNLDLRNVEGLQGLESLQKLSISGITRLADLNPISLLINLEELNINRLDKLKVFPNFDSLSKLKSVEISNCEILSDVSSLSTAKGLEQVNINGSPEVKAGPSIWPDRLISLSLEDTSLLGLGKCPVSLRNININNNKKLLSIMDINLCNKLDLDAWGLDLSGCYSLKSLDGLNIPSLKEIVIPETIGNLDALRQYPEIKITIAAGHGQEKNYSTIIKDIPDSLGIELNKLELKALAIKTDWSGELGMLSGIARVASLRVLDLSDCNVLDITAIASLNNLESLYIKPRTELSKSLGKATYDTKVQIDKLRLKLLAGM